MKAVMLGNALPVTTMLFEASNTQIMSSSGGYKQVGEAVGKVEGEIVGDAVVGVLDGVPEGEEVGFGVVVGERVGCSEISKQRNSWLIKLPKVANVVS